MIEFLTTARRQSLVNRKFTADFGIEENSEEYIVNEALKEIYLLVRNWSEGMDLLSADTKKPTYYLDIFIMLFENKDKPTYKEISNKIGGANVKKYVKKCNRIAISKALKFGKQNIIFKKILAKYYEWEANFK